MDCKKAYRFRINPDAKRREELNSQIILAKCLYNRLLEKTIAMHQKNKESKISRKTLNKFLKDAIAENKDFKKLHSQARQNVFMRLLRAYQNFFKRVQRKNKGEKIEVGFPRFRSWDRYVSITYPQDNGSFKLEKERKIDWLRISKLGRMRITLHRPIEGTIKTLTIKREAGNYYAIFTTSDEVKIKKVKDTNPVGIDVGLKTFASLSDGTKIQKPKFKRKAQKHIAKWQRIVARRVKGSNRRNKAKLHLQRAYRDATNQQDDFLHKYADYLVNDSGYTSFAVEKLQIQNMTKNHRLAKSINDASWSRFIQMLTYKAESAGMAVQKVDARNTSKTCSQCGSIRDMPLSVRIYDCPNCGFHEDRDINAARNILQRATTAGHAGSHARGDIVRPLAREAGVEEARTYPNRCSPC